MKLTESEKERFNFAFRSKVNELEKEKNSFNASEVSSNGQHRSAMSSCKFVMIFLQRLFGFRLAHSSMKIVSLSSVDAEC